MRKTPPLLPIEALRRVLQVARANGTSVLFVAGFLAIMAAIGREALDTWISLLAAGAGAMELHGAILLGRGETRGLRWLVGSQVFLMAVVFGYIGYRQNHMDLAAFSRLIPADTLRQAADQAGLTVEEIKTELYSLTNFCLGIATLIYQGWMIFYYSRRRQAVAAALAHD